MTCSIVRYFYSRKRLHVPKQDDDRAGIGVVLGVRSDGALYIRKICAGGAAEGTNLLVGDGACTRVAEPHQTSLFVSNACRADLHD